MKKTTKIIIEVESDFRKITGKDFGDNEPEDMEYDYTEEVSDDFHNHVFSFFEESIQYNDEFEGEILMSMADDRELPETIKEFSDMGSVTLKIHHEEKSDNFKQRLVEVIDNWYFEWKDKMTQDRTPHSLGFAKEELKRRIELL